MTFKFRSASEGNKILAELRAKLGVEHKPIYFIKALNTEIENAERTLAARSNPSAASRANTSGQTFPKLVASIQFERKVPLAQAVREAVAQDPNLHREWVDANKCASLDIAEETSASTFAARVEAETASGKSKGEAIAFCVRNFPAEYAEWRKGDTSKL